MFETPRNKAPAHLKTKRHLIIRATSTATKMVIINTIEMDIINTIETQAYPPGKLKAQLLDFCSMKTAVFLNTFSFTKRGADS
jgi:hypothetical protein